MTSGKKYWADNTPVAGQQFEYAFDDIGNRTSTKAGGDTNGANLRSASYSANLLNQYARRTVPSFADVVGTATNAAVVTVNDQPTSRQGGPLRRTSLFRQFPTRNVGKRVENVRVAVQCESEDQPTKSMVWPRFSGLAKNAVLDL